MNAWFFTLTSCKTSAANFASSAVSKLSFFFFFLCLCLPPSSFFLCFFFFFLLSFFFFWDLDFSALSVLLFSWTSTVVFVSPSLSLDFESLSSFSLFSESPVCALTCSPLLVFSSTTTGLGERGTFNELNNSLMISSEVLLSSIFSI